MVNEEIINEIKKRAREYLVEYKDHGKPFQVYEKLFTLEDIKQVLSLKDGKQEVSHSTHDVRGEQENKDLDNVLAYWKKQAELSRAEKDKLLSSLQEKIEKSMNELNSDLVCIDFKRNLTKEDYQIITAFFDKINIARIKLGLGAIEHIDDEEELQKIIKEMGE
jgi:hypothetical protein